MSAHTAEEWAQVAAQQAQRATQKAEAATNAAIAAQQSVTMFRRELTELRQELNDGFQELTNMIRNVKIPAQTRDTRTSLTHEDFNPTETGSHFIVSRDTFETLIEEREIHKDANKWRTMWRKIRSVVWTVGGAGGALLLEQLIQKLLHH